MNNAFYLNPVFWSAVLGVLIAQLLKPLISLASGNGWNGRLILSNGGMPSSHTSGVWAVTISIGIQDGFGSNLFILSLIFTFIVMNDAMNVRLETGKQSELLNEWNEFFAELFKTPAFTKTHFKTMVGHTTFQVFWGMIIGIAIAIATTLVFRYYV